MESSENGYNNLTTKYEDQIKSWSKTKSGSKPFLTITREYGSEGWTFAQKLEEYLNDTKYFEPPWVAYNKEILNKIEEDQNLSKELVQSLEKSGKNVLEEIVEDTLTNKPSRMTIFQKTAEVIKSLASHGHVILVGRGGCFITNSMPNGFHIRVVAPLDWRIEQVAKQHNLSYKESEDFIKNIEKERDGFIRDFFCTEVTDPTWYDLILNVGRLGVENAVDITICSMQKIGLV